MPNNMSAKKNKYSNAIFFFPVSVFILETEKAKQSHVDFAQGAFQLGVPLVKAQSVERQPSRA